MYLNFTTTISIGLNIKVVFKIYIKLEIKTFIVLYILHYHILLDIVKNWMLSNNSHTKQTNKNFIEMSELYFSNLF